MVVKALVQEDGSETAVALINGAPEVLAAGIGYVEVRAALARAGREGRVSRPARAIARAGLESLWSEITVLDLELDLIERAGDVAEHARLRAGDAIHLATALSLDAPDLLFASWDGALRRAANELGLAVAP